MQLHLARLLLPLSVAHAAVLHVGEPCRVPCDLDSEGVHATSGVCATGFCGSTAEAACCKVGQIGWPCDGIAGCQDVQCCTPIASPPVDSPPLPPPPPPVASSEEADKCALASLRMVLMRSMNLPEAAAVPSSYGSVGVTPWREDLRVTLDVPAREFTEVVGEPEGAALAQSEQIGPLLRLTFVLEDEPAEDCSAIDVACFNFKTVGRLSVPDVLACSISPDLLDPPPPPPPRYISKGEAFASAQATRSTTRSTSAARAAPPSSASAPPAPPRPPPPSVVLLVPAANGSPRTAAADVNAEKASEKVKMGGSWRVLLLLPLLLAVVAAKDLAGKTPEASWDRASEWGRGVLDTEWARQASRLATKLGVTTCPNGLFSRLKGHAEPWAGAVRSSVSAGGSAAASRLLPLADRIAPMLPNSMLAYWPGQRATYRGAPSSDACEGLQGTPAAFIIDEAEGEGEGEAEGGAEGEAEGESMGHEAESEAASSGSLPSHVEFVQSPPGRGDCTDAGRLDQEVGLQGGMAVGDAQADEPGEAEGEAWL